VDGKVEAQPIDAVSATEQEFQPDRNNACVTVDEGDGLASVVGLVLGSLAPLRRDGDQL
jgi:hypothetical protein